MQDPDHDMHGPTKRSRPVDPVLPAQRVPAPLPREHTPCPTTPTPARSAPRHPPFSMLPILALTPCAA